MKLTQKISVLIFFIIQIQAKGQLSGVYYVPSGIPSIAAAIDSLNLHGVSGAVTINVAAAYTETAVTGGYRLYPVTGASATSSISFVKSGTGNNPKISAYTGSLAPYSIPTDGIWWLIGADYISIDGFDFEDLNTSGNTMMEVGIGMLRNNANDGCQYNTVRNCRFSLQKTNAWPFYNGSTAIALLNHGTGTVSAQSQPSGSNSFNRIYSNYIENVNIGIAVIGFNSIPLANSDQGNDVGGLYAATGNTVVNFGGGSNNTNVSYGIKGSGQYFYNASYNVINNNNGSGLSPLGEINAIRLDFSPNTTAAINNNTVSLSRNGANNAQSNGIYVASYMASTSGTVTIENNVIPAYDYTCSTGGSGFLIYCSAQSGVVSTIRYNSISNVNVSVSSGMGFSQFCMIFQGYLNTSTSVSSNTISNINGDGDLTFLSVVSYGAPTYSLNNNYIDGVQCRSSDFFSGIQDLPGTGANGYISDNRIKNISAADGCSIYGLFSTNSGSTTLISNNEIGNVSTTSGFDGGFSFHGIYFNNGSGSLTISGNTIHSVAATGTNSAASASVRGIYVHSGNGSGRIFKNKIYDLGHEYSGVTEGISLLGVSSYSIFNNLVGKLSATKTNSANAITGINLAIGGGKIYHNTVYLDASSTSTLFGSTCFAATVGSGTSWELRNNIFVNLSTPTGTGVASVIRQSSVFLTNFSSASDRNLYYAGTTSTTHAIYDANWSTYPSLSAYTLVAWPREAHTKTELPPFLSTTGSNANFLNIAPGIPTQVEGNASPLAYISDDYAGNTRNTTTPDIGAWEGIFAVADTLSPGMNSNGFTDNSCNLSQRTLTANISDPTGIASGLLSPRIYYKLNNGSYTSTQGTLSAGTASNGVWTFVLTYTAAVNDVVSYFLAFQDASTLNNFSMSPGTGSAGRDVNTITNYPTQPFTYTINALPVISVSGGSICSGQNFVFVPSGATNYSISGGSFTVAPSATSFYTITGNDTNECLASPVTVSLVVHSLPTISVNNATICQGTTYSLSPTGASTYSYSSGSPFVNPMSDGSYTISGISAEGCLSSNTVVAYITVLPTPTLTITPLDTICPNSSIPLIVSGALSYSWQGGSQNDTLIVSPATSTVYSVYGTDGNACTANATVAVPVFAVSLLSVQGNTSICSGDNTILTVSGSPLSFTWSTGGAGASETITPLSSDTYTVGGTETNGCLNELVFQIQVGICSVLNDLEISGGDLLVFPNPCHGTFFLDFGEEDSERTVKINNLLGQVICEKSGSEKYSKIELNEAPKGIYVLTVYKKELQLKAARIVVE